MQHIFSDNQNSTPKSEVLFLPIIDLNPSDGSCIYSTLVYIKHQARKLKYTNSMYNIYNLEGTALQGQVIIWKELSDNILDPRQWDWKLEGSVFTPILTDLHATPDSLLKFVRCKCKLSYKNPCSTNICSCRKNGLKCVTACRDCHGEGYNNSEEIMLENEEEIGSCNTDAGNIFNS